MQIKMVVTGLTIDPANNAPIVLLRDADAGQILRIWIGVIEASAIAFELEKVQLTRPMTHDLLRTSIEALGGTVQRVMIVDLRDHTYYATVVLAQQDRVIEIDARPSDAIALALRTNSPIFCTAEVIARAQTTRTDIQTASPASTKRPVNIDAEAELGDAGPRLIVDAGKGSMRDLLENLQPEDFGKYKM